MIFHLGILVIFWERKAVFLLLYLGLIETGKYILAYKGT